MDLAHRPEATVKTIILPWTTVYATSTAPRVLPATQWMRVADSAKARATLEIRELMGDIEVEIGVQVANVEDDPNASITSLGGSKTSNGVHYPTAWVGLLSAVEGKQLFRLVFRVKNTGSNALNLARVFGSVDLVLGN